MFKQNYTPDHRRHPGSGGFLISSGRIEAERRWGRRFFAVVFGIWITTALAFGAIAVNWYLHVSLAQFVLMVLFLFSFAFVFSKRLLSLFLPPYQLPVLDRLPRQPRVAVLYATMNDVVPTCVRAIRQAYPCDVYILDDSSDPAKRMIVDRLAVEMGFRLLRRPNREAFKAGAINNWLRAYGSEYDYLVLLDADSALPPDSLRLRGRAPALVGGDAGERPRLHQASEQVDARLDGVLLLRATCEDPSVQEGRPPDDPDGPPGLRRDLRGDSPGDLRPLLIVQPVPRVRPDPRFRADRVHLVDPALPVHHPPDRGHVCLHAREDPAGPPEAVRLLPRA